MTVVGELFKDSPATLCKDLIGTTTIFNILFFFGGFYVLNAIGTIGYLLLYLLNLNNNLFNCFPRSSIFLNYLDDITKWYYRIICIYTAIGFVFVKLNVAYFYK